MSYTCPRCQRVCISRAGLKRHKGTYVCKLRIKALRTMKEAKHDGFNLISAQFGGANHIAFLNITRIPKKRYKTARKKAIQEMQDCGMLSKKSYPVMLEYLFTYDKKMSAMVGHKTGVNKLRYTPAYIVPAGVFHAIFNDSYVDVLKTFHKLYAKYRRRSAK